MLRQKFQRLSTLLSLLLLILAITWSLTGCGSSDTGSANGGATATTAPTATTNPGAAQSDELQVSLTTDPNPAQSGPTTLTIEVKDSKGQPVDGAKVSLSARHPSMTHGGITGDLVSQGSGRYQASGSFSMAGAWRATVTVTKEGLPTKTATFDIPVR